MRLIMNYFISTKIPYSEWPGLVHTFLQKQGLSSKRFMYYFEDHFYFFKDHPDTDENSEGYQKSLAQCGCSKLLQDCPDLGPIRVRSGKENGTFEIAYLSNIDGEPFPEEKLLPFMKKIHRRYAISRCDLYYCGIDFFHDLIPCEGDDPVAESHWRLVAAGKLLLQRRPYGAMICLHRERFFGGCIQLSVDLLHDGKILDAQPYCDALCALLPDASVHTSMVPFFSRSEKENLEATNRMAAPLLQQCRAFFAERFTERKKQNGFRSKYAIAPTLKKLCRQYGYLYNLSYDKCHFSIEKRSPKGNLLVLEVDAGPSRYSMGFLVSFRGLGFEHWLGYWVDTPTDQETADACLKQAMETAAAFEAALFPSLDALFPETPEWFVFSGR